MTDDERDARIETLTDAIAATNRGLNDLRVQVAETSRGLDDLRGQVADTNAAIGQTSTIAAGLAADIASLARLMHSHLAHDHNYPEVDDDGI